MDKIDEYACVKCGSTSFIRGETHGPGGAVTAFLRINTRKFITITCEQCRYTEFYDDDTGN